MKLGRKPAVHNRRTFVLGLRMSRALDTLGSPPAISHNWSRAVAQQEVGWLGNWGMLGNDNYGDCVEAHEGHALMVRTANSGKIVVPSVNDILGLYTAETGFDPNNPDTDQGTDMTSDAQFMLDAGLLGHRADAVAPIDPTNIAHLRWGIQLFEIVGFGVNLPQSARDQFSAPSLPGIPHWTVASDDGGIVGGHAVAAVGYNQQWFAVLCWGKLVLASVEWVGKYLDEAHVAVFFDQVNASGKSPLNFDLAQLVDDLKQVEAV